MKKGKQTLKKIIMIKSKIKTHKQGKMYNQPHFFILNKGLNSGKPFKHYVCNWELRLFRPYLKGTAVEFVRLGDVLDVINETVNSINTGNRVFADVQKSLTQIEVLQSNLNLQLSYLMQLRKSLFHKYLKN